MIRLFLLSCILFVAPLAAQETLAPGAWKDHLVQIRNSMDDAEDLSEVTIPHLVPTKAVARWGAPTLLTSKNGGYWMMFSDPKHSFEIVSILASPTPIPSLASVPDELVVAEVNGQLGEISKPQAGKSVTVKWKIQGKASELTLRYFREESGGGADGPLDSTDAFSLTVNGKTGYYVIKVESVSGATEKHLKNFEVK